MKKEIKTNIEKTDMRKLLELCTKNVHFTFQNEVYQQTDGVAMGSPLGPVLSNIFMVNLEKSIIPSLLENMTPWKRYVDDTIAYIKPESINMVLSKLNSFHENIEFTYEIENHKQLPFLDVMIIREGDDSLTTTVYRKDTSNDCYLNWNSYAPNTWKRGTVKTLVERAIMICSNEIILNKELQYIENQLIRKNGYPKWIVDNVMHDILEKERASNTNQNDSNQLRMDEDDNVMKHNLIIPYKGKYGEHIIHGLRKTLEKNLPSKHLGKIIYTGTKLSSNFNVKDSTNAIHKHDLVYLGSCPEESCDCSYIGEVGRRISERVIDHSGRDNKSHLVKHSLEMSHQSLDTEHYRILREGFRNNVFKRKISEALYIKDYQPTLNIQEKSVPLELFN